MGSIRGVLTDIEGTTTPVSFVYDVLFPYAAARLEAACARAATVPEIAGAVEQLAKEFAAEPPETLGGIELGDGSPYAHWLMRQDRKSTGLKMLQGLIWEEGYRDGSLRAQVFPDVPPSLAAWQGAGLRLRIYSSGSVLAQKLLFAHTEHGDLTPRFEGYHDTTTGPKMEAASYRRIAKAYDLEPTAILFLSDVPAELDAAAEAEMATALLVRPGNKAVSQDCPHPSYTDFDQLSDRLGINP
ncbi:MAG: acireductone synthase [Acidobacteriota bacterium]